MAKSEDRASKLAAVTVGLVQLDQFQRIKENALSGSPVSERSQEQIAEQNRRIKARASKLSFSFDDDEGEGSDEGAQVPAKMARLGPDPAAAAMSEALEAEQEMVAKQKQAVVEANRIAAVEATKSQAIKLNCSFFDGSDRRFIIEGFKGDSIAQLLENAQKAFPPLKGSLVSSLLFIKENVILPHEMTVYEFIVKKAYIRHNQMFDFALDESGIAVDAVIPLIASCFFIVLVKKLQNCCKDLVRSTQERLSSQAMG